MNYGNKDDRVLYNIGVYKYTVSDVDKIYQECKAKINKYDTNDLSLLYAFFEIKPMKRLVLSRNEILEILSEKIAIIANSGDIKKIKKEVRKCRRKFFYWNDLPTYFYFINEELNCFNTKKKIKDNIEINKDFYDTWIELACYMILVDGKSNSSEKIEDDKLYLYKLDLDYTLALKHFSGNYKVGSDLDINTEEIFHDIYDRILKYGALPFYERMYKELYRSFDVKEKRICISNKANTAFPTLWNYSIKALTENLQTDADNETCLPNENGFLKLLEDTENAVVLLEVDNEYDLEFLFPSDEGSYPKRIMNYSSVYDIHQYCTEGMLFLIQRIIDAYSKQLEDYYDCKSEELKDTVFQLVREAQCDFENGRISKEPLSVCDNQRNILDLMSAKKPLNEKYYIPTQWDKINSDSEWLIKRQDAYYIIPPIVSMLGVYDKIGNALGWVDFGAQIEKAVLDLFRDISGLKEYSGKYLFENRVCECDAIILGTEYALIIECKRKGLSRTARGGNNTNIVKELSEAYFSSQSQAYRMQRAIFSLEKQVEFYPSKYDISTKELHNSKYDKYKETVDFSTVKNFIRVSCTGGSFWIVNEGGIAKHFEDHIKEFEIENNKIYIDEFESERDKFLKMECNKHYKKMIELNKLFFSFDRLYDIVMRSTKRNLDGDALLKEFWTLTRVQSKTNDTTNHL